MIRPTAAAPTFPYDHPTIAVVWAREAAARATSQMKRLPENQKDR